MFPAGSEQKGKVSQPSLCSVTKLCEPGSQRFESDILTVVTTFWDVTPFYTGTNSQMFLSDFLRQFSGNKVKN
jgi:hypothetical protein